MDDTEAQDQDSGETTEKSYSQKDVDRIIGRQQKRTAELERQLAERPTNEAVEDLQSQIEALKAASEVAGKSEAEQARHKFERELEKERQKLATLEAAIKERDDAVAAAQTTLANERKQRAFATALTKAKVYPNGASDALAVLLGELKDVEFDDNGAVTASYGNDLIDETPEAIAQRFIADRPHFASVRGGGSGLRSPNGVTSRRSADDMTEDELAEEAGSWPSAS